jgi:hypothetical protein
MTDSRECNEQRKQQGFRDQAHLDANYRYWDHTATCPECQKPGPRFWVGDGMQPTVNRCAVARQLFTESF